MTVERILVFLRGGILLLLLNCTNLWAATCYSSQSGTWTSIFSWSCYSLLNPLGIFAIPQNGDDVVVRNGHTITLNTNTASLSGIRVDSGSSIVGDSSSRTINLSGDLVNNGTISVVGGAASNLTLAAASAWSGTGSLALDYLDIAGKVVTWATSSTMTISLSDAIPFRNIYSGFNNGGTPNAKGTVQLNGSAQGVPVDFIIYPNLTLSGGVKTMASGTQMSILGNLLIGSGATFDAQTSGTTYGVFLAGNLTNTGSLLAMGSNYWTFNGSTAQTISKTAALRGVTLNNSAGLTIGGNLTVGASSYGALTLSRGKLTTGSNAVIIPRNCSGSMVTRTAGSWINGNEQLLLPGYGASCVFDVGNSTNYSPR